MSIEAIGVMKFGGLVALAGAVIGFGAPVLAITGGVFFDSIGGDGHAFASDVMAEFPKVGFIVGGIGAFIAALGFVGALAGNSHDDH